MIIRYDHDTIREVAVAAGAGCVLLILAVLPISARSRDGMTAAGTTVLLLFLFHRFSFKPPLRHPAAPLRLRCCRSVTRRRRGIR